MARHLTALRVAVAVVLLAGIALIVTRAIPSGMPSLPASTGSASGPPAPAADTASSRLAARGVTELLHRRATAIRHRNRAAFLATIDPHGSASFRTAQGKVFDNLADVPLAAWDYTVDATHLTDTAGLSTGGAPAAQFYAPEVQLRYALTGVDTVPTSRDLGYLFDRRGTHWYLVSDTALDDRGSHTWRGPWDFGPCRVTRTDDGLVIAHPDNATTAARAAYDLDGAVQAVTDVWGTGWSRRVAIVLPDSAAELRAMVGSEFAVDTIAAVAIADDVDLAKHQALGQRVVLNPSGAAGLSPSALRVVLRHEITHIATRGYTRDGAPLWLLEGFADYVGYATSGLPAAQAAPDLAAQVRASGPPAALPDDRDFRAGDSRIDVAYQQAWTLNAYLARHFGQSTLVALYRKVAAIGAIGPDRLGDALRTTVGADTATVLRGWQDWLRTNFG